MKKFLGCLGIGAGILVIGFIVLVVAGYYISGNKQEAFFEKINAGDMAGLEQMMSPLLRVQLDSAVLNAVVEEVREQLGTYEGPSAEGFEVERLMAGNQPLTVVTGIAKFSKGETPVELIYVDDQLLGFDIQNEAIVSGAFTRPEVEEAFKARGQQFFELALGGSPEEAYAMLHEEVMAQVSMEQFQKVVEDAREAYGPFTSATFSALKNEAIETGHLKVYYDMVYEKASMTSQVDFAFNGMRASISSFYFSM